MVCKSCAQSAMKQCQPGRDGHPGRRATLAMHAMQTQLSDLAHAVTYTLTSSVEHVDDAGKSVWIPETITTRYELARQAPQRQPEVIHIAQSHPSIQSASDHEDDGDSDLEGLLKT